jgi:DNA-binding transcriptional ArsR family regulator
MKSSLAISGLEGTRTGARSSTGWAPGRCRSVPLGMSLPGVLKHVRALEAAQLVITRKEGRTRWCRLGERPLDDAAAWIDERRTLWATRLDRFGASLEDAGR